ncbi:GNAT family N-acetyltransferase [Halocola ammonii]
MNPFEIYTDRLLIRNLLVSDLEAFLAYRSDPEVARYQGFEPFDLDRAKEFILENAEKTIGMLGEWVQFAIELNPTKQLIGDCAIKISADDHRLGEVGITISPTFQKSGYAKETLTAIVDYLFSLDDFHRITERVAPENTASVRLLESLGFRKEGHFIENVFLKGRWQSELQFALLRKEWEEQSKS